MRARFEIALTLTWIALAVAPTCSSSVSASTLWGYGAGAVSSLHPIDVGTGAVGSAFALSGGSPVTYTDLAGDQVLQGRIVWAVSGFSGDNRMSAMDPVAKQILSSVSIAAADTIWSLAIDPIAGDFYGASSTDLYRISPATGVAVLVGPTGMGVDKALGFDLLGNLYGIANQNQLVAVNKATGATSFIATLGVLRMEDIAIRPETGVMYGLGYGPDYSLFQIDLSNGSVLNVGPSLVRPNGLAFAAVPEPSSSVGTMFASLCIFFYRRGRVPEPRFSLDCRPTSRCS